MKRLSEKKFRYGTIGTFLAITAAAQLTSCGQKSCTILDKTFREAGCKDLTTKFNITAKPPAGCTGANWRNLYVHCPAGTGANSSCTSIADGFNVIVVLVPNNSSGNFTDFAGTGTTYTNCNQLMSDALSGLVAGISGIYVTDNSTGNRLNCNNATGCGLRDTSDVHTIGHESAGCFSGWDSVARTSTGSPAQLTAGTQLLACMYIDNSPLGGTPPPPATYGAWFSTMPAVTLAGANGAIVFDNTGSGFTSWQDAY